MNITPEKIYEVFGVTLGPWEDSEGMGYIFAKRVGGCNMTMQKMTVANTRGWGCLQYHGEDKARAEMNANEKLITTSPAMLVALVKVTLLTETEHDYVIKAIEAADIQGREWSVLKRELQE